MKNLKFQVKSCLIILLAGILMAGMVTSTYAKEVPIRGKVNNPTITAISVDNTDIAYYSRTGSFEGILNIDKLGKNTVWVKGLNQKGEIIAEKRVRLLNLASFKDVSQDFWAAKQIALVSTIGILTGYPDQTFRPDRPITRAEMAAILIRAREIPLTEPKISLFKDVSLNHWGIKYIALAQRLGIIKGYPDKTFKPNQNITRAEGLAMITRFANIKPEAYDKEFSDLTAAHWAATQLSAAYKAGLLKYLENKPFEPKKMLGRAETVEILSRTQLAQQKIAELLSFEVGYESKEDKKLSEKGNKPVEPKS